MDRCNDPQNLLDAESFPWYHEGVDPLKPRPCKPKNPRGRYSDNTRGFFLSVRGQREH